MLGGEESSWPSVTELVEYALAPDDPADKEFFERLRRAHTTNPEKGRDVFLQLIRNPLTRVREFAVIAGPELGGPELVSILPELLDDPNWSVQELAMQVLRKVAPGVLHSNSDVLRRKFVEWRSYDDDDRLMHLAWTVVRLNLSELATEIRRIAEDEGFSSGTRREAAVMVAYFETGPPEILRRIVEHDHENMLFLCRLAWLTGLEGALTAYERCGKDAPDEKCRKRCERFAAGVRRAQEAGEPFSARPTPV
jgi:hypothetical protein